MFVRFESSVVRFAQMRMRILSGVDATSRNQELARLECASDSPPNVFSVIALCYYVFPFGDHSSVGTNRVISGETLRNGFDH